MKLGEIIKNYKTLLFSSFQKKKDMFCESYELLMLDLADDLSQTAIEKLDKNSF
jgi:hypothetical protein